MQLEKMKKCSFDEGAVSLILFIIACISLYYGLTSMDTGSLLSTVFMLLSAMGCFFLYAAVATFVFSGPLAADGESNRIKTLPRLLGTSLGVFWIFSLFVLLPAGIILFIGSIIGIIYYVLLRLLGIG